MTSDEVEESWTPEQVLLRHYWLTKRRYRSLDEHYRATRAAVVKAFNGD